MKKSQQRHVEFPEPSICKRRKHKSIKSENQSHSEEDEEQKKQNKKENIHAKQKQLQQRLCTIELKNNPFYISAVLRVGDDEGGVGHLNQRDRY